MKKITNILLALAVCLMPIITNAQDWSTAGNFISGTEYLGGDNSSTVPLRLKTVSDYSINFFTNFNSYTSSRMTILGGNNTTGGYVGIGYGFSPAYKLDVDGDINGGGTSTSTTNSFRLGTNRILWHNGNTSSIFVGVDAGAAMPTSQGNVFVGNEAGYSQSSSNSFDNTFVGHEAGYYNNGTGGPGFEAYHNSFFGDEAGYNNTTGWRNTFIGAHSGIQNLTGNNNVCLGYYTGNTNTTGHENTFLGANANCSANNLFNASAIGANAIVNHDDQMILGGDFTVSAVHHSTFVGIGLSGTLNGGAGPQNSLEINADPARSAATASGLRFTQVRNDANTNTFSQTYDQTTITPWGKVLTVDENGDVGLTTDAGSIPTCQNATDISTGAIEWGRNPLLHDTEVPMIDGGGGEFNIYFTGQSTVGGNATPVDIGIGYPIIDPLDAKLDVISETTSDVTDYVNTMAGRFIETGSNTGSFGNSSDFIGVVGISDVVQAEDYNRNLGGDFYASLAYNNIGARGTADVATAYTSRNIGLKGFATNGITTNYGVWGEAAPLVNTFNFGVYGLVPFGINTPSGTNYAVYGDLVNPPSSGTDFAGYFNGDLVYTGTTYLVSDASLKTNIEDLSDPMVIINQLQPKSYTFNQQQNPSMNFSPGTHFGLLAQDLYDVLPQLTKDCVHPARYDEQGNETNPSINYKAVNYIELIPFLIAGMKEQQARIEELEALVGPQGVHQYPNGGGSGSSSSIDVVLASKSIVLNQNVPNPFKEQTTIEYFIPDDLQQVKIIFTDNKGSVLKEVEISEKGKGQLNVYAADLSSGIYRYTIVANGVTIDSKQMIKTK